MGPTWNRDDFWEMAQEAAEEMDVPNLERRYYDVLNMFISLSIVKTRLYRNKHLTRMSWTPTALTCLPRSEEEVEVAEAQNIEDRVRIIDAVDVLVALPSPDAVPVSTAIARLSKKKRTKVTTIIKESSRHQDRLAHVAPAGTRPHRKRKIVHPAAADDYKVPVRPTTARSRARSHKKKPAPTPTPTTRPTGRKQLAATFDLSAHEDFPIVDPTSSPMMMMIPPAVIPSPGPSAFVPFDSMTSTRSISEDHESSVPFDSMTSTRSSISEDPESPIHFACDLAAWNAFSEWANGENTLPCLFGDDNLLLEAVGQ